MLTDLLFPWLPGLRLDALAVVDDQIELTLTTSEAAAACPRCAQPSTTIHSHYRRTAADLPWAGAVVRLRLHVRKFFCRNRACAQAIFTERLPHLLAPFARRTQRLQQEQRHLGLDLGGEAGARTAHRQGMPASPDTLLRLVRRAPPNERPTPTALGIDDFARRKGRTYGTILVDLDTHVPVDLLEDRTAATVERWLQQHPGVAYISRDRAPEYADGATRGAPDAVQVADRFHLLQNVREVLERLLERHQAALQAAAAPPAPAETAAALPDAAEPPPAAVQDDGAAPLPGSVAAGPPDELVPSGRTNQPAQRRAASRERRWARFTAVRELHAAGVSIREIARRLGLARETVQHFVRADAFPERATRPPIPSKLDCYLPYLREQLAAGQDNGTQLWRDLRDQHGYTGSRALVAAWVARHRHLVPTPTAAVAKPRRRGRPPAPPGAVPPAPPRRWSIRQAAWLLVRRPTELDADEQGLVERLCATCPDVQVGYHLAQEFIGMVRARASEVFDGWLERAAASGVPELHSFVAGVRRDYAAVAAALVLPYSNGQVEGQITRLKLIKRAMYGRANFDLLRQRVLAA
jgi:transposase